jgi:hypothetical protein
LGKDDHSLELGTVEVLEKPFERWTPNRSVAARRCVVITINTNNLPATDLGIFAA